MLIRTYLICSVLLSILMAGCAMGPTLDSGTIAIENENIRGVIVFSDSDRDTIRHYYKGRKKTKSMPPGLAKKQELPPGLQKHIHKHGELPPGLESRRLPLELGRKLSPLPPGYVRLRVGGDIILLDEKTRVVLDVIWDVLL